MITVMTKRLLTIVLMSIMGLTTWAQPQNYKPLMDQAKSHFDRKEYAKAIDCYEKVVAELKGTEYESLVPTVRNSIAINNLYLGVAALKEKDYPKAKDFFDKAIRDAKLESKTYYMAHSWMGQWNSVQSLSIRTNRGDLEKSLQLSLEAERYFDLAKAPEKRLNEQLARACVLQELSRFDESEALLKYIMAECEGISDRNLVMGKAAFHLGRIEMLSEKFQLAVQHLEQGYNLCAKDSTIDAKSYAHLCADKMSRLFRAHIPDDDKAALWEQRAKELESQSVK